MVGSPTAPIIETARLRLRGFLLSDLDRHVEILAEPVVYRYLSGSPMPREDAWRRMLGTYGLWAMLGYGYWVAERKSDGRMIGQVGFADFKRDMTPSIEDLPEMGWVFSGEVHGQGYAGEAVTAGLAWADEALGRTDIVAIISPGNEPSARLARRSGFECEGEVPYNGEPVLLFRRPSRP